MNLDLAYYSTRRFDKTKGTFSNFPLLTDGRKYTKLSMRQLDILGIFKLIVTASP